MTTKDTLSGLVGRLAKEYGVSKRPLRYFDVPKRGVLSSSETEYVINRFEDLVLRELCVEDDPFNPECYKKTHSDKEPKMKKRGSSYKAAYESFFGSRNAPPTKEDASAIDKYMRRHKKAVRGLVRLSVESGVPYEDLKDVYDIGIGAYASSGSRTGMSAEQWGYGRVYSFIVCYFLNQDGAYDSSRYLKNRTDEHIFLRVIDNI